jgi:hypothetical protein
VYDTTSVDGEPQRLPPRACVRIPRRRTVRYRRSNGAIRSYAYREPTELPCACTDGVPVLSYGEHWSIPCAEHPVSYTEHYSRMDKCMNTLATKRSLMT